MQASLQQNPGSSQFEHLVDLCVDGFEWKNVAVFCAQWPVKRAKRTILGAEIGVIDITVDLIGDDARIIFLQPHLLGGHTDPDQIIGLEHVERLLFADSHD
jgi:hypothetical protein